MGDDGRPAVHGRLLVLGSVAAEAVAELLELVGVRVGRGLLTAGNRGSLPPMLLGFEPFAEFACAVGGHCLPDCWRGARCRRPPPFWRRPPTPSEGLPSR